MTKSAMFLLSLLAVIFVSVPAFTDTAGAAVIYNNGGPDYQDGYASDFGFPSSAQAGEDFTLNTGAAVITDIHWWGFYFDRTVAVQVPPNDDFTIRIFDVVSGVPAINPFYDNHVGNNIARTSTGNTTGNLVFEYSVDVSPISLAPGASYLLSIVNNSTQSGGGGYGNWFWATSQIGDHFYRFDDGNPWGDSNFDLAFELTGPSPQPVPEPSMFLLVGAGLLGLGLLRRRIKG